MPSVVPVTLSPHTPDIGPDPDWEEFAPDSPLEGAGFEPSVPLEVLTVGIVPCRLRGPFHASLPKTKFAADSALEGRGFEPPVPLPNDSVSPAEREVPQSQRDSATCRFRCD